VNNLPQQVEERVPLTGGKFALIDASDLPLVSRYKWYVDSWGYARGTRPSTTTKSGYTTILMHRLVINAKSGEQIDHVNGNPLNNRRCNLRKCTNAQNQMNRRKSSGRLSIFKGVTYHKGCEKWQAQIKTNQRSVYLGLFKNEADAALAYNEKAIEVFGEYARLNDVTTSMNN
jgi:hypothetical protein